MLQQLKSKNELVEYLGAMEQRIQCLEEENRKLRANPAEKNSPDELTIARYMTRLLPQTNILHPNFLKRAFAIWGHFFVANLIIGIAFGIVYFCLLTVLFSSLLQNTR